ncbi:MAG TPA: DUF1697 domain-containing protein [Marmoricola sp.]|nr:DUF1697 domain-containing protein [Marmoricola sp.]
MAASTRIAFLRAINLGRNRRFPMAEVKECLADAGFTDVETHLATGNVRFGSRMRSRARLEERLEEVFEARTGFAVPTIVVSPAELCAVHDAAMALDVTAARRYVTFLKDPLTTGAKAEIDAWDAPGEGAKALDRAVVWWLDHPTAAAKFSNARVERHAVATTRDLKVVATLAERWGAAGGRAPTGTPT